MRTARRKPQFRRLFWRLATSLLAASGLLGHGTAMLLAAWLAAAPDAAASPGFGSICSAGSAPGRTHAPEPPDPCPVCAAFAEAGAADLPPGVLLSPCRSAAAGPGPAPGARRATAEILAAAPRAPPA